MKKYVSFFAGMFLFACATTHAQTTDCLKDFDYLVDKIKADYPGYSTKVTEANRPQLMALEKQIRQKINAYPDSCIYYMNQYTDFFKDHHLRVSRSRPKTDQAAKQPEVMAVSTYGKNITVNVDSLQKATAAAKGVEGVWRGYSQVFAVVAQGKSYVGVVVNAQGWQAGQVMCELKPVSDTVFDMVYYTLVKDQKPVTGKVSIHLNGKIIELHDNKRFVRKTDSEVYDLATLSAYIPQFPNGLNTYPLAMYLSDSTYYLRIPGFEDNTANEFVAAHWNEIMARPNLIIDIRNNGGGQDQNYRALAKIIYTKPYESKGVEWYATKGNIKLFEDGIKNGEIRGGEDGIKRTKNLVEAMKKNVGGYVDNPNYDNTNTTVKGDTVYTMPRNVGIIINERNASSAEQFLLAAKQSNKVLLFGNRNTAGVLDYSNITPNTSPSGKYWIWNPMTRSKRLPDNPIDNIGIAPDVIIPMPAPVQLFGRLDDWVYFVQNYLEFKNEHK